VCVCVDARAMFVSLLRHLTTRKTKQNKLVLEKKKSREEKVKRGIELKQQTKDEKRESKRKEM